MSRMLSVGLFGFGVSNRGVLDLLSARGFSFALTVRSGRPVERASLPGRFRAQARILCGDACFSDLTEDVLFLSPSVRRDLPALVAAKARGVFLFSDAETFFTGVSAPVFGITGSDGKSTTATLTTLLLSRTYPAVECIGNIGRSMSEALLSSADAYVAELSSFQLTGFSPRLFRAGITSFSENHLDWHKDRGEYLAAKENILKCAQYRVLPADDAVLFPLIAKYRPEALVSLSKSARELAALGASVAVTADETALLLNGEPVLARETIRRQDPCTLKNLMFAIAMTDGLTDSRRIAEVAATFDGLPHRRQDLGVFGGVRFIDSSIDSTPARTAATLSSFTEKPVVILGGGGKNLSYEPLFPVLRKHARAAVLYGETGKQIATLFAGRDAGLSFVYRPAFRDAVFSGAELAGDGGVLLLSPASTSFDQFGNYAERGRCFARLAEEYGMRIS